MRSARAIVAVLLLMSAADARAQGVPKDFLVKLERTACFGACPVFAVSVDAAGTVTYQGYQNVRVTGPQTATIPVATVAELAAAVDRIGFFAMQDKYTAPITDMPTKYVSVTSNGRTKRIEDYFNAPASLTAFEQQIVDATRALRWIRIDGIEVRELFAKGPRPPDQQAAGMLRQALGYDQLDVIQALLDNGVNPNGDPSGEHPLLSVQSSGAARLLLAAGADGNRLRRSSRQALPKLWDSPADLAAILLPFIDNIDQQLDSDGRTALWGAACKGNIGVVNLLLAAGANPSARGNNLSAIECAIANQKDEERHPSPFRSVRFARDFDAVVAVLQQRLKQ